MIIRISLQLKRVHSLCLLAVFSQSFNIFEAAANRNHVRIGGNFSPVPAWLPCKRFSRLKKRQTVEFISSKSECTPLGKCNAWNRKTECDVCFLMYGS